ncbi:DUF5397 family protein [Rubrivivax albus]|uniref:Uncharacterized protein n=1 Tax=Rubrivivax albus TaxID=2499835 RepID=A0A3S2UPS6_9BURK|nr:DUF5397 family protein [Rubrivivax albus]RVT51310.1 hypothetical protein ENE75_10720 [Rubrivivax albus]
MTGTSPHTAGQLAAISGVVGRIKTFGPVGPPYLVGNALRRLEDGDPLMHVTLVQTGEVTEYRLSRILDDPDAA